MKIEARTHTLGKGWDAPLPDTQGQPLVLVFGAPGYRERTGPFDEIRQAMPGAVIAGCSTAGEIRGEEVDDDTLSVVIVAPETARVRLATAELDGDAAASGRALAASLREDDLRQVFVLSDGLQVNGSELVAGLNEVLGASVVVSGGLAGDGADFGSTWVLVDGAPRTGFVTAVGFYGAVESRTGSVGGWQPFGVQRTVTRSEGNEVFEIDGQPALALYKEYLGERASELPASGLLFPLQIVDRHDEANVVRTILAIDEERQSLTFAGDVPVGCAVRLMTAGQDRLIDGAREAAESCEAEAPVLAIAVSCVGRRLVLGDRAEEEVEAVLEALPSGSHLVGFYSYGELSPLPSGRCDLHNQTMTLTTLREL